MHEAGIAVAVAAEIRERGLDPAAVRLHVTGGHGDLVAFDAALRAHLEAAAPGRGLGDVRIEHVPSARLCARCSFAFEAIGEGAPCPACGGPGIAVPQPESIELEWSDAAAHLDAAVAHDHLGHPGHGPEGPDDPSGRDSRPSTPAARQGRL